MRHPYRSNTPAAAKNAERTRQAWASLTPHQRHWLRQTYRMIRPQPDGIGTARLVCEFCLMFWESGLDQARHDLYGSLRRLAWATPDYDNERFINDMTRVLRHFGMENAERNDLRA